MEALYRKPRRRGSAEPEEVQIAISGNLLLRTVTIAFRARDGARGSIEFECTDALELADMLLDMHARITEEKS